MEKQIERGREAEPVQYSRALEDRYRMQQEERKKLSSLPRVAKFNEISWEQNAQAYVKYYTGTMMRGRLDRAPICSMTILEQMLFPGSRSGKHRHYFEAIFFVIEGEGYEIHDDVKYPWGPGDIMMVPTYCVHQHFNGADSPVRFLFIIPLVFELMGISLTEQIELHPNYQPPGDAKIVRDTHGEILGYKLPDGLEFSLGKDADFQKMMEEKTPLEFKGEPKTTYDHYLKTLSDQVAWRNAVPHVTRQADRPWENTRMGKIKYLVHDSFPSALLLFDSFIQEIPPGGSSGKHRHVSEEVLKILDGRGYDIQDGQRWDWEAEDVVHIPVNTVHQHFNADPQKTARFVSFQSRLFHHVGHGGIEHFEDAPNYKP